MTAEPENPLYKVRKSSEFEGFIDNGKVAREQKPQPVTAL